MAYKHKYKPHLRKHPSTHLWVVVYSNRAGVLYPEDMIPFMSLTTRQVRDTKAWAINENARIVANLGARRG